MKLVFTFIAFATVLSTSAFAKKSPADARILAYFAITECAAKANGISDARQVNISRPTYEYLGSNSYLYNRFCVPAFARRGVVAPQFNNRVWFSENLSNQRLSMFINTVAVELIKRGR